MYSLLYKEQKIEIKLKYSYSLKQVSEAVRNQKVVL